MFVSSVCVSDFGGESIFSGMAVAVVVATTVVAALDVVVVAVVEDVSAASSCGGVCEGVEGVSVFMSTMLGVELELNCLASLKQCSPCATCPLSVSIGVASDSISLDSSLPLANKGEATSTCCASSLFTLASLL